MLKRIKRDIKSIRDRDPAAPSAVEILLLYPGLHAVTIHRLAHFLYKNDFRFLSRVVASTSRFMTGIEIHPAAKIGDGVFIDHGAGVVIGETAEVGDNCTIYQGVTLGGTGKHRGKRHPTIKDNVLIGAGAKILGPFTVHSGAKIAAGAVVLKEIPAGATAVGVPAKIVVKNLDQRCRNDLDQVNIPDPVATELCRLAARIEDIEIKLKGSQQ